jgi:hypothetical protein
VADEGYAMGYKDGFADAERQVRERIAAEQQELRADGSAIGDQTFNDAIDRCARIARGES